MLDCTHIILQPRYRKWHTTKADQAEEKVH